MSKSLHELSTHTLELRRQARYDEAIAAYQKGIPAAENETDALTLTHHLGETYVEAQMYSKAIALALTALDALAHKNDTFLTAEMYRLLANAYIDLELDDKAIKYSLLALNSASRYNPNAIEVQKLTAAVCSNLSTLYASRKQFDKAISHQQRAIEIKTNLGDEQSLAYSYQNFAYIYLRAQNYEVAAEYCNKAIEIRERLRLTKKLIFSLATMGRILNEKNDYSQALEYLLKAREIAQDMGEKSTLFKEVYYLLPKTYAGLGKHKKALRYSRKFQKWMLKTFREKDAEHTAKLQVQHETAQKEKEILQNKLSALKAQMNPHFLFNGLASIQNFILDENTNDALRYLADFSKLLRKTLDQSGTDSISLEEEIEFLQSYLRIESLRFQNRFDYHFNVAKEIDSEDVFIAPMILQPYVENAIKHGLMHKEGKGTITISFTQKDENTLLATVEDNGIGRKAAREMKAQTIGHKSKGLSITASRLDLLNQSSGKSVNINVVDLEDKNGTPAGTRVEVFIPIG